MDEVSSCNDVTLLQEVRCRKRLIWANREAKFCGRLRLVAMRLNKLQLGLLVLVVLFLLLAWYDGGREPQRLIEQPVETPETGQ